MFGLKKKERKKKKKKLGNYSHINRSQSSVSDRTADSTSKGESGVELDTAELGSGLCGNCGSGHDEAV